MIEQGFYKYDEEDLLFASTSVTNKDYELHIEDKDNYTYPMHGWYYFNTLLEAKQFFNIPIV